MIVWEAQSEPFDSALSLLVCTTRWKIEETWSVNRFSSRTILERGPYRIYRIDLGAFK